MNYSDKKQRLVQQIKHSKIIGLRKNTSNLFRSRKHQPTLDVRDFNNVIKVTKTYVEVEGMTTYETLVNATLKHNVMPAVVPELKTITIGGAVSGIGIESSSFKYGLVHDTILEMEILLPHGEVITCSKKKNKDLFYAIPNSYGTLGYIIKLKAKVIPVKKYVKLSHSKHTNEKDFFKQIERLSKTRIDFIDGTVFSPKEMYITVGEFTEIAPSISDYTYMKIYYKSIQKKRTDYVTTKQYLWRWDTDWFWCSMHFGVHNIFLRLLAGRRFLHSKTYHSIMFWSRKHKLINSQRESIIQDVDTPIVQAPAFFKWFFKTIHIRPLWICPVKGSDIYTLFPMENKLYINFGFWDSKASNKPRGHYNKLIEAKIKALGGVKSLYSDSYYEEQEFWQLYNGGAYKHLKQKYDPKNKAKDLYTKTVLRG